FRNRPRRSLVSNLRRDPRKKTTHTNSRRASNSYNVARSTTQSTLAIRRHPMKKFPQNPRALLVAGIGLLAFLGVAHLAPADDNAAKPYKILTTTQIPAAGGIDYVTADSVNRRAYVACGNAVSVFDLDTYKLAGTLTKASGHGVAIDPENHTGLISG